MFERKLITLSRFQARTYTLCNNHHGPDHATLCNTWQVVRMGSYAKSWTLYVYRKDGRAHALNITFPRWLGPWPYDCTEQEPTRNG